MAHLVPQLLHILHVDIAQAFEVQGVEVLEEFVARRCEHLLQFICPFSGDASGFSHVCLESLSCFCCVLIKFHFGA